MPSSTRSFRLRARSDQELEDLLDAWFAHDHYDDNPAYTWNDDEEAAVKRVRTIAIKANLEVLAEGLREAADLAASAHNAMHNGQRIPPSARFFPWKTTWRSTRDCSPQSWRCIAVRITP